MKAMKHGMIWVLLGMGLAMLLSVWVLGSAQSVSAQVSTDRVLVGAGDIASCTSGNDEKTASLLGGILQEDPNATVATLGDNAYDSGSVADYRDCYTPSWGQQNLLARTMPSVGNHEYYTAGASGYFGYFGIAANSPTEPECTVNCKGYYSYDLGSWHVVVLNSNCAEVGVGGCGAGSPQEVWLRNDLANTTNKQCTLAYFHHPRFSSSGIGNNSAMGPFWKALYDYGAEVVLNGHAHNYERFAPQNADGQLDQAQGIREFVVGTGGKSLNKFVDPPQNNSEVRLTDNSIPPGDFGVIKLTLHPDDPASGDPGSYAWEFRTIDGKVPDSSGSATPCHGAPTSTTDPVPGPPTVISTSPANNTTGIATANVIATFSEEMKASTIITPATTFKLVKLNSNGTTTKITATVSYASATKQAILDPSSNLNSGTYKATVTTGAQDLAGNALDQKPNIAGNQSKSWKFTVQ